MLRQLLLSCLLVMSVVASASADTFLSTERFGYTGSWTRYGSLADAQAGTNSISSGSVADRDLSLYISNGVPDLYNDSTYILSLWYVNGGATPSNSNESFLQIANDPNTTASDVSSYWTPDLQSFGLDVVGANATPGNSVARFGEIAGGAGSTTSVEFHEYSLSLLAGGLNGVYNPLTDRYEDFSGTFPTSVTGSFTAIAENVGTDPSRNGFYAIDIDLNMNSFAFDNGYLDGRDGVNGFASSVLEPEPASLAVWSVLCLGGAMGWRRRRLKSLPKDSDS